MRTTLGTALRIRKLAVQEARRDLLARLTQEAEAADGERKAVEAIQIEAAAATASHAPDAQVEAFASWLPRAQLHLERARAVRCEAEAACNVARAALAAAQTAQEAVEKLMAGQAQEVLLLAARARQAEMDEAAQRGWRSRR